MNSAEVFTERDVAARLARGGDRRGRVLPDPGLAAVRGAGVLRAVRVPERELAQDWGMFEVLVSH